MFQTKKFRTNWLTWQRNCKYFEEKIMDKIDKIDFLLKKTVEYLKINESSMPMSKESHVNNHVFN